MSESRDMTLATAGRIHIVGAGGAGMSGLAKLLSQLGHAVSGSDLKPSRRLDALGDLGIDTWVGHRPQAVRTVDLVVASSAVPSSDPEVASARDHGVPQWSRPVLLASLTKERSTVGFAGTHGKTTSTALAVTGLQSMGRDPSFLLGGELVTLNTGAHLGAEPPFLLEADEAYGTFRHLHLRGLLVTNIEPDHLDYYGHLAALEEAFALVTNRVDGPVVACLDDAAVQRLAGRSEIIGYGRDAAAKWRIGAVAHGRGSVSFRLSSGTQTHRVTVPRPGVHIARNAAGVLALLGELGYDVADAARGLGEFGGVRRRFEVRASLHGVTIVDDYAHHPTEVAATVSAGRLGGWRRVWAVFQPHRYTRTAELAPSFGAPLAGADEVIVTDVYAAGEAPQPGVTGRLVAEAVAAAGGTVRYVPALGDVPAELTPYLEDGDLVLLLGAGDVNSLVEPIAGAIGGRA